MTSGSEPAAEKGPGRIVVGVDGSPGSVDALAWAAGEARLRGATLHAVTVWHIPYVGPYALAYPLDPGSFESAAEANLTSALKEVFGEELPVWVMREVRAGPAAPTLLAAAKGADQLVLGTRGHGGFAGLLLGSVSGQCAHHAPCPLTIVPPHDSL